MMSHGQSYFVDNDKDAVRKAMLEVCVVLPAWRAGGGGRPPERRAGLRRACRAHPLRPAPLNYSGGSEVGGKAFSRPQGGRVYGAEGP